MAISVSMSRDISILPASLVLPQLPVRPCNLARVLHSVTQAKPLAKAGSGGRKSFITCRVISCQGHVPAPGISLHKPQLTVPLREFQLRITPHCTYIPSHCMKTNMCLPFFFTPPSRGLEVAEIKPHGSTSTRFIPSI